MHVATLRLELDFPTFSQRLSRDAALAIAEHLRRHFNVAACTLDPESSAPQRAGLAIVTIASRRQEARATLEHVVDALRVHPTAKLDEQRIRLRED